MTAPLFLLYRTGLRPTNGTSIEMSRLLQGRERDVVHLMWDPVEAGCESVPYSIMVSDAAEYQWPWVFGRGTFLRVRRTLGLNWMNGRQLNQGRLASRLRRFPAPRPLAYVVCMMEWDALNITALLQAVGNPPFVLHVFDIFHERLSEEDTPNFVGLIRAAQSVLCVSPQVEREVRSVGAIKTRVLPPSSTFRAVPFRSLEGPIRLVMSGTIWQITDDDRRALAILEQATPRMRRTFPDMEIHYSGPSSAALPSGLRDQIKDHGRLGVEEYENLLLRSHVAYVPVSHPATSLGRFSLPSRISDYLACGLPVVAAADPDTGLASLVERIGSDGGRVVDSAESLHQAVVTFCGRDWKARSERIESFASRTVRREVVQNQVWEELEKIGKPALVGAVL